MNRGFDTVRPPASIQTLLEPYATVAPPTDGAGAAVMIFLRPAAEDGEVETLLIERAVRPGDPGSGQVGLPGGRVALGDSTLRETALRESSEEVGLGPLDLAEPPRFVGTEHARAFGVHVAVFAAPLAPVAGIPRVNLPEEVAGVFWLPSRALDRDERVRRETSRGPIEVDAVVYEGHVLWGFTRGILRRFFGKESPRDAQTGTTAGT